MRTDARKTGIVMTGRFKIGMEVTITSEEYIRRFRDAGACMAACRKCPRFGRSWSCPPFDYDPLSLMKRFDSVRLIAVEIQVPAGTAVAEAENLLRPYKLKLEKELLRLERDFDGLACTTVGRCPHCDEDVCRRLTGHPCRHPELVRPSLEAYGFDVCRTMTELFGIDLSWGQDGMLPDRLYLTGSVFYNAVNNSRCRSVKRIK